MYEVGDAIPLSWRVLDHTRALADADVTLTIGEPDGTSTVVAPQHPSTGVYTAELVPTMAGRHVIRWRASGAVASTHTDVVNVASATEPVAIISLAQLREHLNMAPDEHVDDEELRRFLSAASLVVEEYTGQVVARRTLVEDVYVSGGIGYLRPPVRSIVAVTSLDGLTTLSVPTIVDGFTGTVSGMTDGWARVTYVAGMAEVPPNYQTATAIIAAHLWSTQRTPLIAAGFGETPTVNPGRGYLIPNQAAQLLGGRAPNRP